MIPTRPYGEQCLFTFGHRWVERKRISELLSKPGTPDGYEQFDLAIIEVDDEGDFVNQRQLEVVSERIRFVREKEPGAIVVGFIHGWHNNADWDNANLMSFRALLKALMLRELEAQQRRVIGVYIGWNGKLATGIGKWIGAFPGIKHATFQNRYRAAQRTGQGDALSEILVELTTASKANTLDTQQTASAPLILIGHSMGAFILQSTFRELLENPDNPLVVPSQQCDAANCVSTTRENLAVTTPDLLLSLNSAAEAGVAKDIIQTMNTQGWAKCFDTFKAGVTSEASVKVAPYNPPLLVSVTSTEDHATDLIWRAGHFFRKSSTDGHDPHLATHTFIKSCDQPECEQADYPDFDQPWHCLHKDARNESATPRFRLDLPDHDRSNGTALTHTAYNLEPKNPVKRELFWLFQIPGEVVSDHTDIFNFKAASFTLAMIQISGVLASAAGTGWSANFSEVSLD